MFDDDSHHATAFSLRRGIASAFALILLASIQEDRNKTYLKSKVA